MTPETRAKLEAERGQQAILILALASPVAVLLL
jgi:hypothetical protein